MTSFEKVFVGGDLRQLSEADRLLYYKTVCESLGLNPLTRPLEYVVLNGKMVLYARRDAADQLRKIHSISIEVVSRVVENDVMTVHVKAVDKTGRTDEDFGAVSVAGLGPEAMANAALKCITKAKRRATLSIAGLGFLDETEVDSIPGARYASATVTQDAPPAIDVTAKPALAASNEEAATIKVIDAAATTGELDILRTRIKERYGDGAVPDAIKSAYFRRKKEIEQ